MMVWNMVQFMIISELNVHTFRHIKEAGVHGGLQYAMDLDEGYIISD